MTAAKMDSGSPWWECDFSVLMLQPDLQWWVKTDRQGTVVILQ